MQKLGILLLLPSLFILIQCNSPQADTVAEPLAISIDQASELAAPALHCIQKPYPYKPGHVLISDESLIPPRESHPAFYGCFDWHSSVHGHWTLVKLLKAFPDMPESEEIKEKLLSNLSSENILKEVQFFYSEGNKTFERTYGWAWLLKLALELNTWKDPLGKELSQNLQTLADSLVGKYLEFLEVLPYPIRVGEHTNTAFGLSFAWDYANEMGIEALKTMIEIKAREFYLDDVACPIDWEPSGFDFISPCLMEADLMARVLNDGEFSTWIKRFMPSLLDPESGITPALVTDRSDPKIVHLDGLNFSRAWCLFRISEKLDNAHPSLVNLATMHLEASLPHITSGNYEGEHWLASFAVYALDSGGQ